MIVITHAGAILGILALTALVTKVLMENDT
jgi:hypothetical protein